MMLGLLLTGHLGAQQTLLATWTFDSLQAAPHTLRAIPSNTDIGLQAGTAYIYADSTNGASAFLSSDSNPEITSFSGDLLNDPRTPATKGMALALANSSANGKSIVFKFSMSGYQNLMISFASRYSGNKDTTTTGFTSHAWAYSTDGINYTSIPGINTAPGSPNFIVKSIDLSSVTAINNQSDVYVRLTVDGATSTSGNNRFDNIQINAEPFGDDINPPSVVNNEVTNATSAIIYFSENLDTTIAETAANYTFADTHTVSNASLVNGNEVHLTISPALPIDNNYTLTISNIEDLSGNEMTDTTITLAYGIPPNRQFATISDLRNAPFGDITYRYTGEAIVTFTATQRNQKYIQDATGAVLIDDAAGIITDLAVGDKITNLVFTKANYNGLTQLTPKADCQAISSDNDLFAPIPLTIAELVSNYAQYESQLVTLANVVFDTTITFNTSSSQNASIIQDDDEMICRNNFRTLNLTINKGYNANVTGFPLIFNTTVQIAPRANSDITEYVATPTVETPSFSLPGGNYYTAIAVEITTATEGATIYYTLDGTTPDENATLYSGEISINSTTTLKAIAIKDNWNDSEVATATYNINLSHAINITSPVDSAVFLTTQSFRPAFTLENFTLGTNGLLKLEGEFLTLYEMPNPLYIASQDMIDVIAGIDISLPAGGYNITLTLTNLDSSLLSPSISESRHFSFVQPVVENPVFSPIAGEYEDSVKVTITCETEDAAIYYTLDGTAPDENATLYTAPINLTADATIKAIAIIEGWTASEVVTAAYVITQPMPEEEIIYQTGFESSEGFAATTEYNNTTIRISGNDGAQWGTFYGTPSTTQPITGTQSMQMRWYADAAQNLGYTYTTFNLTNPTRITFDAKNTNNLNVAVSYSLDGGYNYVADSVFTLTSSPKNYTFLISETGEYEYIKVRFAVSLPATPPTSMSKVLIDNVVVYGFTGMAPTMAAPPVITPNSQFCYEATAISIDCATEDAVIRYTTDGSEPTDTSTVFTEPFEVTGTTTVKAKAWKDGLNPSFVSAATYTFPIEVEDIAAFKAAYSDGNTGVYKITGDVKFVFKGDNRYIYITDESASLLIYDQSGVIKNNYTNGDIISGGVYGTHSLYHEMIQMFPTRNLAASTQNDAPIEPVDVTMDEIINNYTAHETQLVTISDVTFSAGTFNTSSSTSIMIVHGSDTMYCRNNFKSLNMTIEEGFVGDVTGFINIYDDQYQIIPRDSNDIMGSCVERVATPVIKPESETFNNITEIEVTITCETADAKIYYTIDGSTPDSNATLYTAPFNVSTDGTKVKAIAYHPDLCESLIDSVFYQFSDGIDDYLNRISIYPNPAQSIVTIDLTGINSQQVNFYDFTGRLLHTVINPSDKVQFNVANYSSGFYLIKITTDKGIITQKLIKQ